MICVFEEGQFVEEYGVLEAGQHQNSCPSAPPEVGLSFHHEVRVQVDLSILL